MRTNKAETAVHGCGFNLPHLQLDFIISRHIPQPYHFPCLFVCPCLRQPLVYFIYLSIRLSSLLSISSSVCQSNLATTLAFLLTEHPRVRLIHGPVPYAGVVQVLNEGVWHFVCGDLWDFPTANVTCNQLGFQDGALLSLKGFPFGSEVELRNSSKFIVVQCQGLESSLVACSFQEVNTNTCAKGFANVICRNESIDLNGA